MDRSILRKQIEKVVSGYVDPIQKRLDNQKHTIDKLFKLVDQLTQTLQLSHSDIENKPPTKRIHQKSVSSLNNRNQSPAQRLIGVRSIDDIKRLVESQKKEETKKKLEKRLKIKRVRQEPQSDIEEELEPEEHLQLIKLELTQLKEFTKQPPEPFKISQDTQQILNSLPKIPENFVDKVPPPKTRWAICTYLTLMGLECSDVVESWKKYFESIQNEERISFNPDLSNQNLDRVEAFLQNKISILKPTLFTDWPLARTLVTVIEETVRKAGLIPTRNRRRMLRLLYKKKGIVNK